MQWPRWTILIGPASASAAHQNHQLKIGLLTLFAFFLHVHRDEMLCCQILCCCCCIDKRKIRKRSKCASPSRPPAFIHRSQFDGGVNVMQQFVCRFFFFLFVRTVARVQYFTCIVVSKRWKVIRGITNEVEIFKLHFLALGTIYLIAKKHEATNWIIFSRSSYRVQR